MNPSIIFISCDNANGCHDPPPAENNTNIDIAKTMHIGINIAHEKRENFSDKVIIFAFDTRVWRPIYESPRNNVRIVAAALRPAMPAEPECSVMTQTAYFGLSSGAYPTNKP